MKRAKILTVLSSLLAATVISAGVQAASITVNSELDVISPTECTLRDAIQSVNDDSAAAGCTAIGGGVIDTVELPAGDYVLSLTGLNDDNSAGDLDVLANLTLNGAGPGTTSISAQGLEDNGEPERVLHINPAQEFLNVSINGVTIRDGNDDSDGGGILIEEQILALATVKLGIFDGTFTLVTLSDIDVVENQSNDDSGGISNSGAMLIIDNALISGNKSLESGGGIGAFRSQQEVRISNSVIDGNSAFFGAGISSSANLIIDSTTISNNTGACIGGGLESLGESAIITNSTLSGNRADDPCLINTGVVPFNIGGGVATDSGSSLIIVNSTLSGNSAPNGGGGLVLVDDPPTPAVKLGTLASPGLHLYNVTISENQTEGDGGGVLIIVLQTEGFDSSLFTVANTIISGNEAANSPDCLGDFLSEGYNLIGDAAGCNGFTAVGDQPGIDPDLGPLQNNGGPTFTHALNEGSPAIDTANPDGCLDATDTVLTRDQRGETRPVNATELATAICDIGAFEFQLAAPTPTPTPVPPANPLLNGSGCALTGPASAMDLGFTALASLAGLAFVAQRKLRRPAA